MGKSFLVLFVMPGTGGSLGIHPEGMDGHCGVQSASCKMSDQMKHKLESNLLGEIAITSDTQMTKPI